MADQPLLDLDALEAAAKAALGSHFVSHPGEKHYIQTDCLELARFQTALHPAAALALIARLRAAETAACKYASEAHAQRDPLQAVLAEVAALVPKFAKATFQSASALAYNASFTIENITIGKREEKACTLARRAAAALVAVLVAFAEHDREAREKGAAT